VQNISSVITTSLQKYALLVEARNTIDFALN